MLLEIGKLQNTNWENILNTISLRNDYYFLPKLELTFNGTDSSVIVIVYSIKAIWGSIHVRRDGRGLNVELQQLNTILI